MNTLAVNPSDLDLDAMLQKLSLANTRGTWRQMVDRAETENWSLTLDTSKLPKGLHRLEAKAFDAGLSSDTASVNFTVSNPAPGVSSGGGSWFLPAILVIAVMAIVLFFLRRKNKG